MAATGIFLTANITKLELLCNETQIATATGFFLKYSSQWYLVTNWHVLSGRNPKSGQPTDKNAATPDHCRFYSTSIPGGLLFTPHVYHLGDALDNKATWFQHPLSGQDFDIAVLPIKDSDVGLAKDLLSPGGNDPNMFIDLGGELFLPGYPLGFAANGLMPIWKRASLASSLEFGHSFTHFFYVDTATREGMSGAPCLAISNWRHYSQDVNTGKMHVVEQPVSWRFLGMYSGRFNPSDSFEAQIGLVWRENLVLETVAAAALATVRLSGR
jgi:Trypsin-like peptidase domain